MENQIQNQEQVKEVEIHIDEVKKAIAMKNALIALTKSRNWKKVVDDGYFKDEAIRLVMLKGASLQPEQQEKVDQMILSISTFYGYLRQVIASGTQAEADLAADLQTQEELNAEGV